MSKIRNVRIVGFLVLVLLAGVLSDLKKAEACTPPSFPPTAMWLADGSETDSVGARLAVATGGAGFANAGTGQAFSFDGVNDYREVAYDNALGFGTGDFTVALWKKRSVAANNEYTLIEMFDLGLRGWTLCDRAGALYFAAGGTVTFGDFQGGYIGGTDWVHVAVTRGGGITRLYVNGVEVSSTDKFAGVDITQNVPLLLGRRTGWQGFFFPGLLDDIILRTGYGASSAEISALYSAGPGELCSDCGNGVLDGDEQCDDGNTVHGDGCDGNCTLTGCGNGIKTAGEACDDGNFSSGDGCEADCTLSCGNGVVDPVEQCDDGNLSSGDGCEADCTPSCGNGVVDPVELCDDGNTASGDGCSAICVVENCGDGIVADTEQCDDGNRVSGDGCDWNCTPTACGNGVRTGSEECDDGDGSRNCRPDCRQSWCGDGVINPAAGEQCDDGNLIAGDGCDPNCRPTGCGNGYVTTPELCDEGQASAQCNADCTFARCGDGIVNGAAGESCDDANTNNADGCSTACQSALPCFVLPGGPASLWALNGDFQDQAGMRTATVTGGVSFLPGAGSGWSRSFAVFNGTNGWLSVPRDSGMSLGAGDFTIGVGVVKTFTTGTRVIAESWDSASGRGWSLWMLNNQVRFTALGAGGGTEVTLAGGNIGANIPASIMVRRLAGVTALFVNGVSVASTSDLAGKNLDVAKSWLVGRREVAPERYWQGVLIDLFHYNGSALSDAQIASVLTGYESKISACTLYCGDGVVQSGRGEACDDGNAVSGDGCDRDCQARSNQCGNGVQAPGEQCDQGAGGPDCDGDCTRAFCGDGVINAAAGEQCDDGNPDANDGCDPNCRYTGCGNGFLDAGETCDAGSDALDCDGDCSPAVCGDAYRNTAQGSLGAVTYAPEACDDGNLTGGDGCEADCSLSCGNGVVDPVEQCEDGNLVEGDGCDSNCTFTGCGNGLVTTGEECDIGGGADHDCDPDCTVSQCGDGFSNSFAGEECDNGTSNADTPNACRSTCLLPGCGDAILDYGEACDSGAPQSGLGCDEGCVVTACGNGVLTPGQIQICNESGTCVEGCDGAWAAYPPGGLPAAIGRAKLNTVRFEDDTIYLGGDFGVDPDAGGSYHSVAAWSLASGWNKMGNGLQGRYSDAGSSGVREFARFQGNLIAAGDFELAGSDGRFMRCIAQWDGTQWAGFAGEPFGRSDTGCYVLAMYEFGGELWIGGNWTGLDLDGDGVLDERTDDFPEYIMRWNGSRWLASERNIPGDIWQFAEYAGQLLIATDGGVYAWDGSQWALLGGAGGPGTVRKLLVDGDKLYALEFGRGVWTWDGSAWSLLVDDPWTGLQADGQSYQLGGFLIRGGLALLGGKVFYGPTAGTVGGWDDHRMFLLGSGLANEEGTSSVDGLAVVDGRLLVVGNFSSVGGTLAVGLAVWNPAECGEQCDDGNATSGDGCDANCTPTGCGNGVKAGDEVCDDGNTSSGDGCDANCTPTGCGNGVSTAGETCDDGNLVDGDGCQNNCTMTPVVVEAAPGQEVQTPPASPAFPVAVSLTTPNGGAVSLETVAAGTPEAELDGIQVLGTVLKLTAPPSTAEAPIVIRIVIDVSSVPPGVDPLGLVVTRNGVVLPACTGAAGVASPDPCLASRERVDDTVVLTALSSHASAWGAGVAKMQPAAVSCLAGVGSQIPGITKAVSKQFASCLKGVAKGKVPDLSECATGDPKGKTGYRIQKAVALDAACTSRPNFGYAGIAAAAGAAVASTTALGDAVLGSLWNNGVAEDPSGIACQAQLIGRAVKVLDAKRSLFFDCQAEGLAKSEGFFVSSNDLATCITAVWADAGGTVAKAEAKFRKAVASKCDGLAMNTVVKGACASAADPVGCLLTNTTCRLCMFVEGFSGSNFDCDALDDGLSNASCN